MATFDVEVTQVVRVTLDETKFDDAFMEEFRENFYPFMTLEDHAEHIAQLQARGVEDMQYHKPQFSPFVEGYGQIADMGITAKVTELFMDAIGSAKSEAA